jgi:hypothetical protein
VKKDPNGILLLPANSSGIAMTQGTEPAEGQGMRMEKTGPRINYFNKRLLRQKADPAVSNGAPV